MSDDALTQLRAALTERCADCYGNEDYHACSLVAVRVRDEA